MDWTIRGASWGFGFWLALAGLLSTSCDCSGSLPQNVGDGGVPAGDGGPQGRPAFDAGQRDAGSIAPNCGAVTCGPGERCETGSGAAICAANTCAELNCTATERCEAAATGSGHVCTDISCIDSIQCAEAEHCDGTICVADTCVASQSECSPSGEVRRCNTEGSALSTLFQCGGDAYFTSTCSVDPGGAYCPCEDDWDCPAHSTCEAGRCQGTGAAPTCLLPAAPFDTVLPTPEPGFPWGGTSISNRDAVGSPFPASSQVVMTPLVVNLDDDNGDGNVDERDTPEIVFLTFCNSTYTADGVLRAVHGGGPHRGEDFFATCGSVEWIEGEPVPTCSCGDADLDSTAGLAAGDIDGDGLPEIVAMSESDRVRVYSNLGKLLLDAGGSSIGGNASPSIANLDGQGFAEVIAGAHVFTFERDALGDLALVDRFDGSRGQGKNGQGPISCVANLLGGPELEIIGGSTVYRMPTPPGGVTRRSQCASGDSSDFCQGVLTEVWDARTVNGSSAQREGFCAVADVLGANPALPASPTNPPDGNPDVVLVSSGKLQIFDGATGTMYLNRSLGVGDRGGAPNVDDFDGDGFPEIGTAGSTAYAMYDLQPPTALCPAWTSALADFATRPSGAQGRTPPTAPCAVDSDCGDVSQFVCSEVGACICLHNGWLQQTEDSSSKVTGSSVFDFNGDGAAEVVYNDECYFRVYSGLDGSVLFREASESRTRTENPVVADVDNDGNAEIVFATSNESGFCSNNALDPQFNNGLEVWGDASDLWVSARRIWNEHAYHVTNVLESGGIPTREPESWRTYGGRQYNTYRSQPRSFGVAPNLVVERVQVSTPGAMCGALGSTLALTARVANRGDVRVGPDVRVSFTGTWDAGPVTQALYVDASQTPLTTTLGSTVEPGDSVLVTVLYNAMFNPIPGVVPGTLPDQVEVMADSDLAERECREDDNSLNQDIEAGSPLADLTVELGAVTGTCPGRAFETTLRNVGSVAASNVTLRYYYGDPEAGGSAVQDEVIAGPLAPGASTTITPSIDLPSRRVNVFVVADPDQTVEECNDANNTAGTDERYACSQLI